MILKKIILILFVILLTGCMATGPKYKEVQTSIPAIESGKGRIYFYRPANFMGGGIRPSVNLNGKEVGKSTPGGFFYIDRATGDYEVVLSTEVDKKLTFQLDKGEEQYVRMTAGMGVIVARVYPELVEQGKALEEMSGLNYIGQQEK